MFFCNEFHQWHEERKCCGYYGYYNKKKLKNELPRDFENPVNKYFPTFIIGINKPEWKTELSGTVYLRIYNNGKSYKIYGFGKNGIIDLVLSRSD